MLPALLDVYMVWNPSATLAPLSFPASSSNVTILVRMSRAHSSGAMVPRHATTMSRYPARPASAAPAAATYPIQLAWPSHAAAWSWRRSQRGTQPPSLVA